MKTFLRILGYILILVLPYSIISFFVCVKIYNKQFKRFKYEHSLFPSIDDYQGLERTQVSFLSKKKRLTGYLYGGESKKGLVIISHGIGASHEKYLSHINYFVQKGYQVLGFDNTGSGISEGKSVVGLVQSAIDLNSAIEFVRNDKTLKDNKLYLFGHSWGGYAVLSVLNVRKDIDSAVSICGYNSAKERFFERMFAIIKCYGYLQEPYMLLYQYMLFGRKLNNDAIKGLNKSDVKALIYQGGMDQTVKADKDAVYAKKDDSKNKKVKFILRENLGHNNLLLSESARALLAEFDKKKRMLNEKYQNNVPKEELDALYNSENKVMINEPNDELMEESIMMFEA
ncbi:alpha/beta fold hydrolase [Acholeplasma sp. OttesenSCG-928-E16]|nr:alpha/beta fold hydrolase [Acholeplasma sp. OttesenSCG-928-E16]